MTVRFLQKYQVGSRFLQTSRQDGSLALSVQAIYIQRDYCALLTWSSKQHGVVVFSKCVTYRGLLVVVLVVSRIPVFALYLGICLLTVVYV